MMNITNKLAILGIVLSAILTAGCMGGGDNQGGYGYGGDSLELFIDTEGRSTFDSGENFAITISAENFGPFDVSGVRTRLIGFGGVTLTAPNPATEKLSDWKNLAPNYLVKPKAETEEPGGIGTRDWAVTAPTLDIDSPIVDLQLTGEVKYETYSLAKQQIVVVEKEYLNQLEQSGQSVPVNTLIDSQNGPVSIDVVAPSPYVTVRKADKSFTLKVSLNNDGSGVVFGSDEAGSKKDYIGNITLTVPDGLKADTANCDFGLKIGSNPNDFEKEKTFEITPLTTASAKLRLMNGGKNRDVSCRFLANATVAGYQSYQLYAETEYIYKQDAAAAISIQAAD